MSMIPVQPALEKPSQRPSSLESPPPDDGQCDPQAEAIQRVLAGDLEAFEILMRRYNRRVFRTARSIVRNDAEAEDAAQDAWVAAYRHLDSLEAPAAFSSWLMRITVRCALARARRRYPVDSIEALDEREHEGDGAPAPEEALDRKQVARVLESAIDALPATYRVAVMLRDVEQLSTAEAAEALGVSEENLRVRLHRARNALRAKVSQELDGACLEAFAFDGQRCDRLLARVLRVIGAPGSRPLGPAAAGGDALSSASPPEGPGPSTKG